MDITIENIAEKLAMSSQVEPYTNQTHRQIQRR